MADDFEIPQLPPLQKRSDNDLNPAELDRIADLLLQQGRHRQAEFLAHLAAELRAVPK
jgi:hypothetical protein